MSLTPLSDNLTGWKLLPDRTSGFYSQYFIVLKRDGGLCPVLDLQALNYTLMKFKFKMLTTKLITSQIRSEDWFVTVDLKGLKARTKEVPQDHYVAWTGVTGAPPRSQAWGWGMQASAWWPSLYLRDSAGHSPKKRRGPTFL
ncbi:hypothetical protein QTP70_016236 [Hemibagrus guttatus]|uniref:Uncharacterized protein n=1 Tax=Hemibagrus guttatus TaxID=175788 RepID=A0AAE0QJ33_9TELE|nr:hypothetical protein QTP70_016236 [Hemibagrus guttatus]